MAKKSPLEEICLYYLTHKNSDGSSTLGRVYNCYECDGEQKECKLYFPTKPTWNKYGENS